MQSKDYRIIVGIAYPNLVLGENRTNIVKANVSDTDSYYYDDAVRLSERDVKAFNNLKGHPLCVEHDENHKVGEITHSWTDEEGRLRFMARVNVKDPAGQEIWNKIHNKELACVSVGYTPYVDMKSMEVNRKQFREISLCKQGFFPGARISVSASKEKETKSGNFNFIFIFILFLNLKKYISNEKNTNYNINSITRKTRTCLL